MGIIGLVVLLVAGYSVWRVVAEKDEAKRKALLGSVLGYAVTIALGFIAFKSGLFWLIGFIVLAHLLMRAGVIKKKVQAQAERMARPATRAGMTRERALEVLGVPEGASDEEIKNRYKELMRRVHPDRGGSSYLATELNEARRVLLG